MQLKEQTAFWSYNFKELETKTNTLGDECSRLNQIIRQRDEELLELKRALEDTHHKAKQSDAADKSSRQLVEIL